MAEPFELTYTILYGHCVPAADVVTMMRLISKANDLDDVVTFVPNNGEKPKQITRQQMVTMVVDGIINSVKVYSLDENIGVKPRRENSSSPTEQ
jgi:hypothetical protein